MRTICNSDFVIMLQHFGAVLFLLMLLYKTSVIHGFGGMQLKIEMNPEVKGSLKRLDII
jgi:hypothetical protein